MNHRRIWTTLLAALLCMAALCGCTDATGIFSSQNLLQLPATSQPLTAQQIADYLGETAQLKYPVMSQQQTASPFTLCDLDEDGTEELLVQYQSSLLGKESFFAVFAAKQGGGWYLVQKEIAGFSAEAAAPRLVHFSGGNTRLMIEYPDAEGGTRTLAFYEYAHKTLYLREQLQTQSYLLADILGDGKEQLAEIHKNEYYQILQLRLYDGTVDENNMLQERAVSTMDPRLESCSGMFLNTTKAGDKILLLDFSDSAGNAMSDAVRFNGERFTRCYTSDDGNVPNFTARSLKSLSIQDADGDGQYELPRLGVSLTAQKKAIYTVFWYGMEAEGESLHSFGFVDAECRFYLCIPRRWYGIIYLQEDGDLQWSVRQLSDNEQLVQFCFVESEDALPPAGDWQKLLYRGNAALYVQAAKDISTEDYQQLLTQSRLLL